MPEPVSNEENVHSFLAEEDLNKKKRLKWETLMPGENMTTSVCRTEGGHDVRQAGEIYAEKRERIYNVYNL